MEIETDDDTETVAETCTVVIFEPSGAPSVYRDATITGVSADPLEIDFVTADGDDIEVVGLPYAVHRKKPAPAAAAAAKPDLPLVDTRPDLP